MRTYLPSFAESHGDRPVDECSEPPRTQIYSQPAPSGRRSGAKALLRSKNVSFDEIDVTDDPERRAEMECLARRRTVPQIFIDGKGIDGFDDAGFLDATGELDRLLGISPN